MNKKLSSFFCDPKTTVKNAALFLLMIFLVVYAFFQILPTFTQSIEVETALLVSVYDTTVTTGYIFRDEEVIQSTANGVPVTLVKDGERISKGQPFANVYSEESSAGLQEQINAIDRKIEILSKSIVDTDLYVTDITKTDDEINGYFDTLFASVAQGNLSEAVNTEKNLLVSLNKKDLIIHVSDGYQNEIAALQAERSALQSRIRSVSQQLSASTSGYYYGDTDGYENIFTVQALDNLSIESFHTLISSEPAKNPSGNFGKIVKDFVWYLVCQTDKFSAAPYQAGNYYRLTFPAFSEDELKMELTDVISVTSEETALLVFRGNTAPEGFPYLRMQEVDICNEGYTGLAVPKEALRIVNGKQGVYILDGDIVRFRLVQILFENEDSYIVSAEAPTASADDTEGEDDRPVERYLSLYDSIIVSGKALFDGKTVG